jgi:hypothetical protein
MALTELTPPRFMKYQHDCSVTNNYVYLDTAGQYRPFATVRDAVKAVVDGAEATKAVKVGTGTLGMNVARTASIPIVSDLRLLDELNTDSYRLDTNVTLYLIQYYEFIDINDFATYVSRDYVVLDGDGKPTGLTGMTLEELALFRTSPLPLVSGGLKWCKYPKSKGAYPQDSKGVLFQCDWYHELPGTGKRCRYQKTEESPVSYEVCNVAVYNLAGSVPEYYIGNVQNGFDLTSGGTFFFGQLMTGIWGCTDAGFPVGNSTIWQTCLDPESITQWINTSTQKRFPDSDTYNFGSSRHATELAVAVKYVTEFVNAQGFQQGTWKNLDETQAFPEASILGGKCELGQGDTIGIVVDLASDSVGLNKILPIRLLLEQYDYRMDPSVDSVLVVPTTITSNTSESPHFVISPSSEMNANLACWNLFDGHMWWSRQFTYTQAGVATSLDSFNPVTGVLNGPPGPGNINGSGFKIQLDKPRRFNYYRMAGSGGQVLRNPTEFDLYGSNDDENYVSVSHVSGHTDGAYNVWRPPIVVGFQQYRFIVFHVTKGNAQDSTHVGMMRFEIGYSS